MTTVVDYEHPLDWVRIERAMQGYRVQVSRQERPALVWELIDRNTSQNTILRALRISHDTFTKIRAMGREAAQALAYATEEEAVALSSREHLRALDQLADLDVTWPQVAEWAARTGQWTEETARADSTTVVRAYLAMRRRADDLLAVPGLWAEVVAQCETYAADAPPQFEDALRVLGEGARRLLAAHASAIAS